MRGLTIALFGVLFAAASPVMAADPPQNFIVQEPRQPVPEVQFEDAEGRSHSLAEFHGKVVLVNVWATWCVPCRKEMPTLDRLQGALGGADFEVVAVSIDRGGPEVVRNSMPRLGFSTSRSASTS